jgi:hypothetical protein
MESRRPLVARAGAAATQQGLLKPIGSDQGAVAEKLVHALFTPFRGADTSLEDGVGLDAIWGCAGELSARALIDA